MRKTTVTMHTSRLGAYGISHGWWVVICVVYCLSPIDALPELLLGPLGLVDDFGVMMFGFYSFLRWIIGLLSPTAAASTEASAHSVTARAQAPQPPLILPRSTTPATPLLADMDAAECMPNSSDQVSRFSVFEVQVVEDDDGSARFVDVSAPTAEYARNVVAAKGADGRIAKVRLKGSGGNATDKNGLANGGSNHESIHSDAA